MTRSPALYQVNTRVWLTELSQALGRPATLDDVPDAALDRMSDLGFDWVWFLSVWRTGLAGRRRSRAHPELRKELEETLPDLRSKGKFDWGFTFTTDYQEQRTRDDMTWQIYDLKLDLPLGPLDLTVGKQKEPFVFEMVGLMPQLPTQERILSPFFVTRNTGLQLRDHFADDRMTWVAGAFNDWLETGDDLSNNSSDYVARLTGLPWVSADNRAVEARRFLRPRRPRSRRSQRQHPNAPMPDAVDVMRTTKHQNNQTSEPERTGNE